MVDEGIVQLWLWERYRQGHTLIVNNAQLHGQPWHWEADLISVIKKSQLVCEAEIKLTKSDFLADQKKKHKHFLLSQRQPYCDKRKRGDTISFGWQTKAPVIPNYFRYVVPAEWGLGKEDVPDYAGLLVFECRVYGKGLLLYFHETKRAPRLHDEKITDTQKNRLAMKLMFRYWNAEEKKQRNRIACKLKERQPV